MVEGKLNLTKVVGFDIGGVNTKAAFVHTERGHVVGFKTATRYFPVWKEREKVGATLLSLKREVSDPSEVDAIGITMTAELADSYRTKREGVNHILNEVEQAFPSTEVWILDINEHLMTMDQAHTEPLQVAAANWVATGWMVSQLLRDCIILDVGSTTTSIIPVVGGEVAAEGKTDLEKLMNGELVYTGSLRTNLATIIQDIPMRNSAATVASELFAQSGDMHLVLGNITTEDYTVETPDGKGKTRQEAMARLARLVCADTESLSESEILHIAEYTYDEQVKQISAGLSQVYSRNIDFWRRKPSIVVTGLGRNFLAKKAAKKLGFDELFDLEELVMHKIAKVSTAVGVAFMAATKLEGGRIEWMP